MKSETRCKECGNPVLAKELCRTCYDKGRKVSTISISRSIQHEFERIISDKGWTFNFTANFLMKKGIKFIAKQKAMREEWEID